MTQNGFREDQIAQVRGLADQRLRKHGAPLDPLNRRISLIVQYREKPAGAAEGNEVGASAEKSAHGHGKRESTCGGQPAAPKKE
jgi:chemotaxis protein MotB